MSEPNKSSDKTSADKAFDAKKIDRNDPAIERMLADEFERGRGVERREVVTRIERLLGFIAPFIRRTYFQHAGLDLLDQTENSEHTITRAYLEAAQPQPELILTDKNELTIAALVSSLVKAATGTKRAKGVADVPRRIFTGFKLVDDVPRQHKPKPSALSSVPDKG